MSIKKLICIAALLSLPALLITCDDNDELNPRPYPTVKTYPVDGITSESVTFDGELITLGDGVIDHGFLVARDRNFASIFEKLSRGPAPQTGPFDATLHESMEEGVTYYVRAYAQSKSHQVLGQVVDFISLGSKAPELLSISPTTGTWGDKIVLKGKQFSAQQSKIVVRFGEITAQIETTTKDSIVCKVPSDLHHAPNDVSVSIFGNISKLSEVFQLTKPTITSISAAKGFSGASVTIKGNFFRTPKSDVYFGNVEAHVTKTTATEIECVVPVNAGFGIVTVRVAAGTGNLFAETTFEISKPIVLGFSPKTGTYRNTIVITGEDLNPESTTTSVKFGDSFAPIVSKTSTQIEVTVPDYLTSPASVVTVTTESGQTTFDAPFTLLPIEITSIEPTEKLLSNPTEITVNGKNFAYVGNQIMVGGVPLISQLEEPTKVVSLPFSEPFTTHELDLTLSVSGQTATVEDAFYAEWIKPINSNPNEFSGYHSGMQVNDDLYVFVNLFGVPGTFKLNQDNNTWEHVGNSVPPSPQDQFIFSLNGKGYVGGGTYNAIEPSFELHEFDQSTNQWTQLNDVPFESLTSVGFAIGNIGYVATSEAKLWQYNAAADSWAQLNNVPTDLIPRKGFMHNNAFYGLTENNYLVRYNEASDTWEKGAEFPGYFYRFLFQLNGRLFFRYEDWWGNYNGPVTSFNLNALDEKEHPLQMGYVQYCLSTDDRALLFPSGDLGQPIQWLEYKPYEE
jgi:hypothetical protein